MIISGILLGAIMVLALGLGPMGSVGFEGIAIADDYYSGGKVVDNPGGGKRTQYDGPVNIPPSRDMSGGTHGGTYTHGQAVWFPQGSQPPATPPPPPPQQSVSGQGGNDGGPGDTATATDNGNNSGITDTPPQSEPNYVPPQQTSQQSASGKAGNNYNTGGFTPQELSRMSPEERELARRGIIHKRKYGN